MFYFYFKHRLTYYIWTYIYGEYDSRLPLRAELGKLRADNNVLGWGNSGMYFSKCKNLSSSSD